jgi:hypothetical protein
MLRYSIADLIDRLAITLLKHWHLEEELKKRNEKINETGAEKIPEEEIKETAAMFESSVKLNQYRNLLIEEINEFFRDHGFREDRSK